MYQVSKMNKIQIEYNQLKFTQMKCIKTYKTKLKSA